MNKQSFSMNKNYNHQTTEERLYEMWEKGGYFTPKIDKSKNPFTIILPLPNANDPMHMGHALFTVEDILVRYHRMLGEPTLWLPGADHAGIETQFVFEKYLAESNQSRFDFSRHDLYQKIEDFVQKNKNINKDQLKRLGFSLDWSRYHYSLEPEIVEKVLDTFKKLHDDGLIYRGERIVNFCTKCGTAFSDLEVEYVEKEDALYYLDYGPIKIATTRPETIFADVAVAVNPKDKRYQKLVGQKAVIPLINVEIPILTDKEIDLQFGTGALKVTPAYDPVDFEIGQKNNLEVISIINRQGKMIESKRVPPELVGLRINQARQQTVEMLKARAKLVKQEPLTHNVGACYRCHTTIEPLVIPQWYLSVNEKLKIKNEKLREDLGVNEASLSEMALLSVKKGLISIVPGKRFEKLYFDWMEKIKDWNISRQIVWGPQIPVWYCLDCNPNIQINFIQPSLRGRSEATDAAISAQRNDEIASSQAPRNDVMKVSGTYKELKVKHSFEEINKGLQSLLAEKDAGYQLHDGQCDKCHGNHLLQETDTFDTWFLSSQWPVNTLKSHNPQPTTHPAVNDFDYFYPTSVLDTLWDILFFWVGRMMMMGIYLTGKAPFKVIHIHARVVDKEGKKMSKSKGNVLDPIEMVDKYGADALRMALIIGVAPAADISLNEDKIRSMRNFTNKIWNIGRFILLNLEGKNIPFFSLASQEDVLQREDKKILEGLDKLIKSVTDDLDNYRFGSAAEDLYEFLWHEFADKYIEKAKGKISASAKASADKQNSKVSEEEKLATLSVLRHVFLTCLKLLHPFMPYITEELWGMFSRQKSEPLIISPWPI